MATVRLTTAQAIVKFLKNQYVQRDGKENQFLPGYWESSVTAMWRAWARRYMVYASSC